MNQIGSGGYSGWDVHKKIGGRIVLETIVTQEPLRILKVSAAYYPNLAFGGPIEVIMDTTRYLRSAGHEVTIFTSNLMDISGKKISSSTTEGRVEGCRVVYFNSVWNYRHFCITPALWRVCHRELGSFDVVHLYGFRYFQVGLVGALCRRLGVPYVIQVLGTLPRMIRSRCKKLLFDVLFGRSLLAGAAGVIAKTDQERSEVVDFGYTGDVWTIRNGFEPPVALMEAETGRARSALGIKPGEKVVTFVGRVTEVKGLDLLIEGFAQACLRDARLVIVGPDEGGYQRSLMDLASELGLISRVIFAGGLYGRAKYEMLRDSDVFVLPSYHENLPRSLLEAMACGVPVIIGERCGLAGMVQAGGVGLVVRNERDALARALRIMLGDKAVAQRMGQQGPRIVREQFGWKEPIGQILSVYRMAAGGLRSADQQAC